MRTERWLVAPDGTELDCASMHALPQSFASRFATPS
jgi:hypothetical protein